MQDWSIWVEGYVVTGQSDTAKYICSIVADTFEQACVKAEEQGKFRGYGDLDRQHLSLWGCRLYPTEYQARQSFG